MLWETKKLPDGRWGIFLCKKFCKFPDQPVCYGASITKDGADRRVSRLNNPGGYSNDEKCFTVGMARAKAKKEREAAKAAKKEAKAKKKKVLDEKRGPGKA